MQLDTVSVGVCVFTCIFKATTKVMHHAINKTVKISWCHKKSHRCDRTLLRTTFEFESCRVLSVSPPSTPTKGPKHGLKNLTPLTRCRIAALAAAVDSKGNKLHTNRSLAEKEHVLVHMSVYVLNSIYISFVHTAPEKAEPSYVIRTSL